MLFMGNRAGHYNRESANYIYFYYFCVNVSVKFVNPKVPNIASTKRRSCWEAFGSNIVNYQINCAILCFIALKIVPDFYITEKIK